MPQSKTTSKFARLSVNELEARDVPASLFPGIGFNPAAADVLVPVSPGLPEWFQSARTGDFIFRADVSDRFVIIDGAPAGVNVAITFNLNKGDLAEVVEVDADGLTKPGEPIQIAGDISYNGRPAPDALIVFLYQESLVLKQVQFNPDPGPNTGNLLYQPDSIYDLQVLPNPQPGPANPANPANPVNNNNDANGDGFDDNWVIAPVIDDEGLATGEPIDEDEVLETGEGRPL